MKLAVIDYLRKGIRSRLIILGVIPIILFVLLNIFYTLPSMRRDIDNEKKNQTREMVNISLSVLNNYHNLEKEGRLTRQGAQEEAIKVIRAIRFGPRFQDYFWINDFQPKIIMHPYRTDLEGKDVSSFKDPQGVALFVEFVKVCKHDGAGYVPYLWQYYDDEKRIEPKLSYVATFEPWGWIIGTGIYVNDVDATVAANRNTKLLFILGVAIITVGLVIVFANSVLVKPLNNLVGQVALVGEGDFTKQVQVKSADEIGYLADTVNKMVDSLKKLLQNATETSRSVKESSQALAGASWEMSTSLEKVVQSTSVFADGAQKLRRNSQEMADTSKEISKMASTGDKAINNVVRRMQQINEIVEELKDIIIGLDERSQEIGKVMEFIKGIADQTNLLALNAAIEAARAGEHGRGFAVVAEEVRVLAEQSAKAASEITELIKATQRESSKAVDSTNKGVTKVNSGTKVILYTGETFRTIVNALKGLIKQIEDVAAAAEEIGTGSQEVSSAMEKQSATMEQVSASAQELRSTAEELTKELARFKF